MLSTASNACPEVIIPVDPANSALRSKAWAKGLKQWRKGRYEKALKIFRKTEKRMSREIRRLFHPKTKDAAVDNVKIQKWLQRYVYTERPSVLIKGHRFTFPALVWWSIADSACRTNAFDLAEYALKRVQELRNGGDVNQHMAVVKLYRAQFKYAARIAKNLPPDGFITPYIEGWLAAADGKRAEAQARFRLARSGAALEDQRKALKRRLDAFRLAE